LQHLGSRLCPPYALSSPAQAGDPVVTKQPMWHGLA
jgi:hypothetical protein